MTHKIFDLHYEHYRVSVRNEKSFHIESSFFNNSVTSEYQGGAIKIETSEHVNLKYCVFERCSATNFGGPFSITSVNIEVYKVCCRSCWLSQRISYHNGCAGFLNGSESATHSLSSIYDCAPSEINTPGFCIFAFHHCQKTQTKNVNASHCHFCGYFFYYDQHCEISFSTFDELDTVCLYFHGVKDNDCYSCNLLRHRGERGSLYGDQLQSQLALRNIIFYNNNVDVAYANGEGFKLYSCSTDKSAFYVAEAINCSVGIKENNTIIVENAKGCLEQIWAYSRHERLRTSLIVILLCLIINHNFVYCS